MNNRYTHHFNMQEIGVLGQERLAQAKVLCVGAGGLASPVLYYLASAGVGTLAILDGDRVSLSNLQRQILFVESDVGEFKAVQAAKRLSALNSQIVIEAMPEMLTEENAEAIFSRFDIIIDTTDRFSAKFLVNDTAARLGKPVIIASVQGFEAQIGVFDAQKTGACYRCIYREEPKVALPDCTTTGVLGAWTGWVGSFQAIEAVKLIVRNHEIQPNVGTFNVIDGATWSFSSFQVEARKDCPICEAYRPNIVYSKVTHDQHAYS